MIAIKNEVSLILNGEKIVLSAMPHHSLLHMLRENGTWDVKCACAEGDCGSCTLLLDGQAVKSCLIPAMSCEGKQVWTISGLGRQDVLTKQLQEAFVNNGAVQCGFCSPGMIAAARDYIVSGGGPERENIRIAISGNLCRCTGYEKIIRSIAEVAQKYMQKERVSCPNID